MQAFAHKKAVEETDRATFQAMEALVHNLNTMNSRAGAQVPFSSINYGMDTSPEARMVMRNLLLSTEQGLGNGETPIFPIQIFKALFEQEGILTHAKAAEITLDTAFAGVGELPIHPGAVRYYQEVNLMDAEGKIIAE